MKDKRRFVRITPLPSEPVEIHLTGQGLFDGLFIDVLHAKDISEGGVGVEVLHSFKGCDLNQEVELIIDLPGIGDPFKAKGRVRHMMRSSASGGFFGVEFAEIAPVDLSKIKKYIHDRVSEGA